MKFFGGTIEAACYADAVQTLRERMGENLRQMREAAGFATVDEAANALMALGYGAVTPQTLRNYEKGASGLDYPTAWRLADLYGTSLGAIGARPEREHVFGRA